MPAWYSHAPPNKSPSPSAAGGSVFKTSLSTEGLFARLSLFQPNFYIGQIERLADCQDRPGCLDCEEGPPSADGGSASAGGSRGEGVEVISREIVGPYDRVILSAESVADLRRWLDDNAFQIPENTDEKLEPYIDTSVFVAVKLVASAEVNDIVPLALSFPGEHPSIPIVPTSVAAVPDMGIVVYVLGEARAIPSNCLHVQINDAAIDWPNGGRNCFDVVAQAADEADGKAFATDFAGAHVDRIEGAFTPVPAATLEALGRATTIRELADTACQTGLDVFDADVSRVLTDLLSPPGESAFCESCLGCVGNAPGELIDGAALAALFVALPYLTRLFTTLSPEEMVEDPAFTFGRDLPTVDSAHEATMLLDRCDAEGFFDFANSGVRTPSGVVVRVENGALPDVIVREGGQTVRQGDEPGAAVSSSSCRRAGPRSAPTTSRR